MFGGELIVEDNTEELRQKQYTVLYSEASNGRLGLNLPIDVLREGLPSPTHLKIPGVKIVSLTAGGM